MDSNKVIIVVLIAVIIALLIGIAAVMGDFTKPDSQLTIIADSPLTQGDALVVKLSDNNGNPLKNQTVNITLTDKDNQKSYSSIVTGDDGRGNLKIDENPGEYDVAVSYGGGDKYSPSNAAYKITVEAKVAEASISSGSSTHTVMGEDGYYYVVDDSGNILESLGPSQKYYPQRSDSVNYPDAEPSWKYIDKSK